MNLKDMLGSKKVINPAKKDAKMEMLKELRKAASEMMSDGIKGKLNKVTVAAKDAEGLEKGLDKAKELVSEEESKVEGLEEALGADLDNDNEEGESLEHKEAVLGEMSPEEIEAKIAELMELKNKLASK